MKHDKTDTRIAAICAYRLQLPLRQPYENALGRLNSFDVMTFGVSDGSGRTGWGEACPVTGYSPESPDQAWTFAESVLADLIGRSPEDVVSRLTEDLVSFPFVVSALYEAIDDLTLSPCLFGDDRPCSVELLGTVNTLNLDDAPALAVDLVAQGYRTLKVKVGYEPDSDAERVRAIAESVADQARLRIDANQGYSAEDAIRFARQVPVEAVEVFEQPVAAKRWDLIEQISGLHILPLMLDESIYDLADIEKAASLDGVTAVKLKMSKAGGPRGLARQVALCRQLGLNVVIGNGIASDLGCYHEALCYHRMNLEGAAEMNGFLKIEESLLSAPLRVERAMLVVPEPSTVRIDRQRMVELASYVIEL